MDPLFFFLPQALPISPASNLLASGGEGGQGEVATKSCALQARIAASPSTVPPQKERRSYPARALIASLALPLPDRAQPSPRRSH